MQKARKEKLRKLGYIDIRYQATKFNYHQIMPLLDEVLNTDLSALYNLNSADKSFYVYMHCNPLKKLNVKNDIRDAFLAVKFALTHVPFYVGKGTGNRYLEFNRNDSHRKIRTSILNSGNDIIPVIIANNLTEAAAFSLESKLIDILGLKSLSAGGMLVNLDEGLLPKDRRKLYPDKFKQLLVKNGYKIS